MDSLRILALIEKLSDFRHANNLIASSILRILRQLERLERMSIETERSIADLTAAVDRVAAKIASFDPAVLDGLRADLAAAVADKNAAEQARDAALADAGAMINAADTSAARLNAL